MEINTQYIEYLNDYIMLNRNTKKTMDTSNPEVLQIGVGGFTSCGKTLLYDAIVSLFGDLTPYYLPMTFKRESGKISPVDTTKGKYSSYMEIQNKVQGKISQKDIKTPLENGTWNLNTYEGILNFCGQQKKIIIRDIPGEIFRDFYTSYEGFSVNASTKSFNEVFRDFCSNKSISTATFGKYFKENKQSDIEKLRDEFFDYLKQYDSDVVTRHQIQRDNFYAYLFFKTSDVNIYCLSFNNPGGVLKNQDGSDKTVQDSEQCRAAASQYLNDADSSSSKQPVICFTQFDRIIDKDAFFKKGAPETSKKNEKTTILKKKWYEKFWLWIWLQIKSLFDSEEEKTVKMTDELDFYWTRMEALYEDIMKTENHEFITKPADLQTVIDHSYSRDILTHKPHFLTSTALHNEQKCFFEYEGTGNNVWTNHIIRQRRSMGVLEMMLYILKKNGFNLDKSSIPYSKYRTIGNKIDGHEK